MDKLQIAAHRVAILALLAALLAALATLVALAALVVPRWFAVAKRLSSDPVKCTTQMMEKKETLMEKWSKIMVKTGENPSYNKTKLT